MADTEQSLALSRIQQQNAALRIAMDDLLEYRKNQNIDRNWVDLQILKINNRRLDLINEFNAILLTTSISNPPTAEQVADLRAKVEDLRNRNVTAEAIQGIVSDAFAIAATVQNV